MRAAVLLLALAAAAVPATAPAGYVQAVEFPYYAYPRQLWDRELVWLKNIGVRTVAFSIPSNWHQLGPGDYDLTGRTSPRRDLVGLVKLMRRLGLHAWIRLPATANNSAAQHAWLRQLDNLLSGQTVSHGGAIEYVEGGPLAIDAAPPPQPVTVISATDPTALAHSRGAIASAHGALLWRDVEDALYPAGWEPGGGPLLHKGAVGLSGEERTATAPLRRDSALLRNWSHLFPELKPVPLPKPAAGKFPEGVSALELACSSAAAVSLTNIGKKPFHDELRVLEPVSKHVLVIPGVTVGPGESLWLPVSVSLGQKGLCRDCTSLSAAERIVYATAELQAIEYENGILAMEFAAAEPGEVILQMEREPVGPFLAAGKPMKFDWDDKTLRARLTIPANPAGDHRVRIGLAIEEPETSAFFNEARRLIIGQKNTISTSYSSKEVAARSRLRLPEGYTATPKTKSETEIDYEVVVPADAVHGDFANLALETDGVLLGRARLQLFRPANIRIMEAIQIHFGQHTELQPDPPVVIVDPKAGTNLEISIRNNWPVIQTYKLAASGDGLEFFPPRNEISIGAMDERRYLLRTFAGEALTGLRQWRIQATGGTTLDLPVRAVLLPRGRTVVWSTDLDGDGSPEWVLESGKVRAIFSSQDGGRWMEFTWKDTNSNFLPEAGLFAAAGPVEVRANGDQLEFTGKNWKRTISLADSTITVEQTTPLAADAFHPESQGNIDLTVTRTSPTRATYRLK